MATTGIPGSSISLQSGQTIERAVNALNTSWLRPEQIYNAQLESRIAYFDYGAGDRLEFYMRVDGQTDEDKGDTETRNFGETEAVKVASVGFGRIDLMAEKLPLHTNRDPLGLFLGPTEEAIRKAIRLPTRRAAFLLRQGTTKTCLWDGLSFFNTAHKVNPANPKNSGVFPNLFTGFVTNEKGWFDLLDSIERIKGANDYLINQGFAEADCVIWAPTRAMARRLQKIFDPEGRIYAGNKEELRGAANTETAAAAETTLYTRRMGYGVPEIMVVPELYDGSTAAQLKRFIVFNTRYANRRPLVVRIPRGPQWRIDRSISNPLAATNNAYPCWADMEFGIDFALPHLATMVEEA